MMSSPAVQERSPCSCCCPHSLLQNSIFRSYSFYFYFPTCLSFTIFLSHLLSIFYISFLLFTFFVPWVGSSSMHLVSTTDISPLLYSRRTSSSSCSSRIRWPGIHEYWPYTPKAENHVLVMLEDGRKDVEGKEMKSHNYTWLHCRSAGGANPKPPWDGGTARLFGAALSRELKRNMFPYTCLKRPFCSFLRWTPYVARMWRQNVYNIWLVPG